MAAGRRDPIRSASGPKNSPPKGRAMKEIAKAGPIAGQADRVVRLLHSPDTVVHLVTLLEDLPVTETLETVAELQALNARSVDEQARSADIATDWLSAQGLA